MYEAQLTQKSVTNQADVCWTMQQNAGPTETNLANLKSFAVMLNSRSHGSKNNWIFASEKSALLSDSVFGN